MHILTGFGVFGVFGVIGLASLGVFINLTPRIIVVE